MAKDQILEAYLNMVPFRGELSGIHAMSRTLFEKHPSGLDQVEAAIAVSLIRAPNAAPAIVAERACRLLQEQKLPQYCLNLKGRSASRFRATARLTNPVYPAQTASPARCILRGSYYRKRNAVFAVPYRRRCKGMRVIRWCTSWQR
jgi:hypothetical protein